MGPSSLCLLPAVVLVLPAHALMQALLLLLLYLTQQLPLLLCL
jgi:hypothetical protein